ncbi:Trichothecene efflux pump TRI12 [Pseudocercospora fuligena]|uniref:Trichothecene efflux pump TRI12 n=1 Tax=Pseudocercospora fuligena TaxID=685502 RepID=A0A8H6RAZ2_9PEZI|nr:Trichothecene efflux pump TRI12 [Pseudocercospora fuligena]
MDHEKSLANSSSDPDITHVEEAGKHERDITDPSYVDHRADDDRADEAKGRNADKIDKSYWLSVNFIGTLFAIGMAFMGGIGGYGLIAPVLSEINAEIGPDPNINWVPLCNLCGGAVFFLMVGQLSDIFGRRWFFIIGSAIALIGSIIGATAQSVNQLIASQVFIGIAVAFQQSFFWVVAEIVPMKYRYIANGYCYLMTTPTSPLAARVAFSFQTYPGKWRNSYYFLCAINATSILAWYLFYHPPTFSMLHRKKIAKDLFIHFDWIGLLLYTGGMVIFIFGLNWGGVLYPWNSPQVIATCVVGGVTLFGILPAYEIFIKKRGKEPYLPLHLFTNIRFQSAAWNTGIGACVYYGFALVVPQVVTTLWYGRGEISEYDIGTLAGLTGMAFVFAQMCHGIIVWFTGPKWAMIGSSIIAAALLTACAADLDNRPLTIGLLVPGAYAMGIVESVSITTSTFPLRSQEEIGQGGGLSGSTRNFTSAIAVAVYTATLSNRLIATIPQYVYPVARSLGLSENSFPALAMALQGKGSYTAVSGITPDIQAALQEPYRQAFKHAASTVFLVSLAFSGTAIILAFFTTNNDKSTENYVAGALHTNKEEKQYRETQTGKDVQ